MGTGAGRLMTTALDRLRAAGFTDGTPWVLDSNDRGRRMYECAGVAPDGATKDDVMAERRSPKFAADGGCEYRRERMTWCHMTRFLSGGYGRCTAIR